jgi:regulator of nucleoside diphosphate kinase
MQKFKSRLLLAKDDYDTIMSYIKRRIPTNGFNRRDAEELQSELKKAKLVPKEELPEDVVRLNSRVKIKEENENKIMEFTVVTPEKANFRRRLISIMSPIGTALIGFRKGQQVNWKVPSGKKTFTIVDVENLYG